MKMISAAPPRIQPRRALPPARDAHSPASGRVRSSARSSCGVVVNPAARYLMTGGEKAGSKAWEGAQGLEWTLPSPAPYHSFETPPVIK